MTDSQLFQVLQTIVTLVTMVLAYLAKRQSNQNAETLGKAATAIEAVEKQTNHIKDELVAATAKASHLEGAEAGRSKLQAEQKEERAGNL